MWYSIPLITAITIIGVCILLAVCLYRLLFGDNSQPPHTYYIVPNPFEMTSTAETSSKKSVKDAEQSEAIQVQARENYQYSMNLAHQKQQSSG